MESITFSSEPEATPEDIEAVRNGLRAFNRRFDPDPVAQSIRLFLRDGNNIIQGGLIGEIWNGWLYIDFLWVADHLRQQGYGAQLMSAAEQEANRYGCYGALLDTLSFQARPFYQRLGYKVFAQLPDCPRPGMTRYYMRKTLPGPQASSKETERE